MQSSGHILDYIVSVKTKMTDIRANANFTPETLTLFKNDCKELRKKMIVDKIKNSQKKKEIGVNRSRIFLSNEMVVEIVHNSEEKKSILDCSF